MSSCDIAYTEELEEFHADYLQYTKQVHDTCADYDLSEEYMVIGTSAIVETEIDGAVGMNSILTNRNQKKRFWTHQKSAVNPEPFS